VGFPRGAVALPIALAAGAVTALTRWTPIYDPDCFWHLHTGRYIVTQGAIPWLDVFSHTARGQPWRFIDVLSDVILYGAWRLGGASGLLALTVALGFVATVLSVLTQARVVGEEAPRAGPLLVVAPLLVATVAFRLTPRPQTFTFVVLAALLFLIVASRARPRLLWMAPALVALWQNLHPSGPLAVMMLAALALGSTLDRRAQIAGRLPVLAWTVTAVSAVALLFSPHPIDRLTAGFLHAADPRMAALITEWEPIWRLPSPAAAALVALLLLALIGVLQPRDRRPETALILVGAGLALVALRAVRFIPLGGLALAPLAAAGVARLTAALPRRDRLLAIGALAVAGLAPIYLQRKPFGTGVQGPFLPIGAADFIARTQPRGNLVHEFEMGGYLMWTLGPAHPVFVDGRSFALYDTGFLAQALQLTPERLAGLIPRHDLRLGVFWTNARLESLQKDGWHLVYLDDVASVLLRGDDAPAYLARHAYRELHPARWWEDMERFGTDAAALARADDESARMVKEAPGSALAWVVRASIEAAAHRGADADRSAATALRLRPDLIAPHRMMMFRCGERRDRACVCNETAFVRAAAPRNIQAISFSQRFFCAL
jgi:hypothetical protein